MAQVNTLTHRLCTSMWILVVVILSGQVHAARIISEKLPEKITILSQATSSSRADRDAVQYVVGELILQRDILEMWRPELTAELFEKADMYSKSTTPRHDGYYVELDALGVIRKLIEVIFGSITPRVAVCTSEVVLLQPNIDPAVETEISNALLKFGFQLISPEFRQATNWRHRLLAAKANDADIFMGVAQELDADILVVGQSFAEESRNRNSLAARVEFKVIEGSTGRVLSAVAQHYTVNDTASPLEAGKRALMLATKQTPLKMVAQLLNAYGKPITRIRVQRVRGFSEANRVREYLRQTLPGSTVNIEQMHDKGSQNTMLVIMAKQDIYEIAGALENMQSPHIRVTSVECRNIVCEMQ